MSIYYTNECVECNSALYPCTGKCSLTRVAHLKCDRCKEEVDKLYWFDGKQLCADCVLDLTDEVEVDGY